MTFLAGYPEPMNDDKTGYLYIPFETFLLRTKNAVHQDICLTTANLFVSPLQHFLDILRCENFIAAMSLESEIDKKHVEKAHHQVIQFVTFSFSTSSWVTMLKGQRFAFEFGSRG